MAQAAVLRESCGWVARIRRAVEIRQMAGDARSREPGEHVVFVTLRAGRIDVSPGQRKLRRRAVIERRACPTYGRMTRPAVLGKACSHVVWIGSAVEIRQVAGDARSREPGKHVVFMTLGTRSDIDMSACQWERRIVVVERCALPIRR